MKKLQKTFLVVLVLMFVVAALFACQPTDEPSDPKTKYTVTFDLDGGTGADITAQQVEEGTKLSLAKFVPTKDGYTFEGWTIGGEVVTEITVSANVTVKATWKNNYEVETNADGTYALVGINISVDGDTLVLPEMYLGKKVTVLKATAFVSVGNIKNLVIGNSYVAIEAGAFAPLAKLESVTVPFYGTSVDADDFVTLFKSGEDAANGYFTVKDNNVTYLVPDTLSTFTVTGGTFVPETEELHIKNLVVASTDITEIDNYTIYDDSYIESIDLSGCTEITKIGDSNFNKCNNLRSVSLAGLSKLKYMGTHSFYFYESGTEEKHAMDKIDMSGLTSLETVGQSSFWYLDIKELDFSETAIVAFGRQNVYYCEVETIKLPQTLNLEISNDASTALEKKYGMTYLDNSEFLGNCSGIADIVVPQLSVYLVMENGALYDIDKTVLYKYVQKSAAESYTAPASFKVIKPRAFQDATNLTSIDLTACTLTNIGYSAFDGCNAALSVGFDQYGYYAADGSKVALGNSWMGDCEVTYGTRYLYFTITPTGLQDGMTVCEAELTFDVTATYGDDDATVEVKLGDEVVTRGTDGYTVTLTKGENVIMIVAVSGNNCSEKTYKVTYDDEWILHTSLDEKENVVWCASDNLTFTVWATDAKGNKKDIGSKVEIKIDCGMSSGYFAPSTGVTIEYDEESKTVTVEFNTSKLLSAWWEIYEKHHIKVSIKQSNSVSIEKIYDAQYFEDAPVMESETLTDGNSVSSTTPWKITVKCKLGKDYLTIVGVKIEMDVGDDFFSNSNLVVDVADDKLSATATVDMSKFQGYVFKGDPFSIRLTITMENGLKVVQVFNAEFEG